MKAHNIFKIQVEELIKFNKATQYSYKETHNLLKFWRRNKLDFDSISEFGYHIKFTDDTLFTNRRVDKVTQSEILNQSTYVRLISILEIFLVDLIRDAFLVSKEPFKNQDLKFEATHAEILSIKSHSKFYQQIITKECRKLSSGGITDIVKYYKKNFGIYLSSLSPGISKLMEYHDRRHLIVHRLGRTDFQYRKKYNVSQNTIKITDDYLFDCFDDLSEFAELINKQMKYTLHTFRSVKRKKAIKDRTIKIRMGLDSNFNCLKNGYEFWA